MPASRRKSPGDSSEAATDPSTEVRALVSLLADEDPKITGMVWEHLNRLGTAAIPALREASEAADPVLRARARHALGQLSLESISRKLRKWSARKRGSSIWKEPWWPLARIEYPELASEDVPRRLGEIAARIRPGLLAAHTPSERTPRRESCLPRRDEVRGRAARLERSRLLAIQRVLERRVRCPDRVSQSSICWSVNVSAFLWPVSSAPQSLHGEVQGEGQDIFIDPFYNGQILTRRQCVLAYLRDYYPKDAYIQTVGGRGVIAIRALRGLTLIYAKRQDKTRVRWMRRFLETLQARERAR